MNQRAAGILFSFLSPQTVAEHCVWSENQCVLYTGCQQNDAEPQLIQAQLMFCGFYPTAYRPSQQHHSQKIDRTDNSLINKRDSALAKYASTGKRRDQTLWPRDRGRHNFVEGRFW